MAGMMAPVMIMTLAMGIEVTSWSVTKLELQRIADISAWAGASQYAVTNSAQSATQTAADVAEINGAAGTAGRTWNAATLTMADDLITAQLVSGMRSPADKAVKVVVRRSVAKSFSLIFPSDQSSVTLSASTVAEIGSLGPQPCITALGGGLDGITTGTDVSVVGNASLKAIGCSLRSNDGISQNGNASINTDGVYAGGSISGSGICCDVHANAGQIPDPYAGYAPLQSALSSLHPGSGSAISVNPNASKSIEPGTYSSWNVKGTLHLGPGLYVVNGDVSSGAQSTISGTGVTIVMSGTLNTTGGSSLALTAPTTSPVGGAVPGVLLAGNSSATMAFLGNSMSPVTGVLYFPNANLKFAGTSSSGSDGCTEVVASKVTLVGTSDVAANCSAYGVLNFGSLAGPSSIALVQ
jgi:hypothetical protein